MRAELDRQRAREGGLQERREQLREREKQLGRAERRLERLEDIQKQRTERVEQGRRIIEEPDRRVIVKDQNKAGIIRHDETERLRRVTRDFRSERRTDGITVSYFARPDGTQVFSEVDDDGRLLRRYRRTRDGREVALIDNRRSFRSDRPRWSVEVVDLPPIALRIPRERYIVDYSRASDDDLYDTIAAEPLEPLTRRYSLEEVRWSHPLRERMRRVDLDDINFEFGSWEITFDQMPKLERLASAIKRLLDRRPDEVLLIEGYTDAVGSEEDNLTLSDRRAEAVATGLTQYFDVPPENLVTQGYGEQFLKLNTQGPERLNRRVALRRITPFLERERG
jgi:outer membrane protein OmpA-like peptidoglycan-associated protein